MLKKSICKICRDTEYQNNDNGKWNEWAEITWINGKETVCPATIFDKLCLSMKLKLKQFGTVQEISTLDVNIFLKSYGSFRWSIYQNPPDWCPYYQKHFL